MAIDSKFGHIDIEGIPDDEPIFIIRAKDKSAPSAINQYADTAIRNGSPEEHAAACRVVAASMLDWQEENPDAVKASD